MGGQVIAACFEKKCVVASVCHGPMCFAKAVLNGEPVVKGKKVTGFSNAEEEAVGLMSKVPFSLQDKLTELGGIYSLSETFITESDKRMAAENHVALKSV